MGLGLGLGLGAMGAPSLAVMTWRMPALGLSSSAQKVAMQLSGTPGHGDG